MKTVPVSAMRVGLRQVLPVGFAANCAGMVQVFRRPGLCDRTRPIVQDSTSGCVNLITSARNVH